MEAAGRAVADEAARLARSRGRIVVLCGPGNNGGDGFVAARASWRTRLSGRTRPPRPARGAVTATRPKPPAGSPARSCRPLRRRTAPARPAWSTRCSAPGSRATSTARRGAIVERINAFARAGGRVLAVDTPSGVDGATGKVRGVAVEATASVTFFRLKPGHLLEPGRGALRRDPARRHRNPGKRSAARSGRSAFVNGPRLLGRRAAAARRTARTNTPAARRSSSPVAAHQTGAARLAARAALRAGAGIVAVASPPEAVAVNAAQFDRGDGRAVLGPERIRGAARRRAPAGRGPRPGRRASGRKRASSLQRR